VKFPIVSITHSQLCDHRVGAHLCLHGLGVQTQLSYMGGSRQATHLPFTATSRHLGQYQIVLLHLDCKKLAAGISRGSPLGFWPNLE